MEVGMNKFFENIRSTKNNTYVSNQYQNYFFFNHGQKPPKSDRNSQSCFQIKNKKKSVFYSYFTEKELILC